MKTSYKKELQKQIDYGCIHMRGNFFCDVEQQTEKAVKIQYLGMFHWVPKSAFQGRKHGDLIVFGMQQWMINKIYSKY